jgi:hypothetical protein
MKAMAPQHPEWEDNPLYAAVLNNDMKTVAAGGERAILELATITHAGMTTDEFAKIVEDWIASARHPKFNRLYTDIIYQPIRRTRFSLLGRQHSRGQHESNGRQLAG